MDGLNWIAILAGTALAFGLGMLWFGPIFGRVWALGSHNIQPPQRPPLLAMGLQLIGTFLLALVVGMTEMRGDVCAALAAIAALTCLQAAGGIFSQKSLGASLLDGGFALAMGFLMIAAQAIL